MLADRAEERLLVCVGPAPGSARLIQACARQAKTIGCPWIAAYVALPAVLGDDDRTRIGDHLRLAEALGADAVRLSGRDAAVTLCAYAAERRVTRILIGKPEHPRWHDGWAGGMVERLVRASGNVDVHLLTGVGDLAAPTNHPTDRRRRWLPALAAMASVLAVSLLAKHAGAWLSDADVVMAYLLVVLVTAHRSGTAPALVASGTSVAAYNFFFVPPFHTFAVADSRNLLTFAVLFGVGFAGSTLSDRLRGQEAEAVARESRTAALLALTRALVGASDEAAVCTAVVRQAVARLGRGAALFIASEDNFSRWALAGECGDPATLATTAGETHTSGNIVSTPLLRAFPVQALGQPLGVLVLAQPAGGMGDLAEAYAGQAGLALARARAADAALHADLRARTEQVRSALLSAVSHDLRTPLAAITLASTALLDPQHPVSIDERRELIGSVRDEAERLERLVENLLEMTRISSGSVTVRREWVPLEEILGSAFVRLGRQIAAHPVQIKLPPDLPLVWADPILLELLVVNLVGNAAQHTPAGTPVTLCAYTSHVTVSIMVSDEGPGLPDSDAERLFEPFVRGQPARTRGSGLGLAICRGIARAHGGDIAATNNPGGGACFTVALPTGGEPPPVPLDASEVT